MIVSLTTKTDTGYLSRFAYFFFSYSFISVIMQSSIRLHYGTAAEQLASTDRFEV